MARQIRVELRAEEEAELEQARDHHAKPYVREAAAAILKVAQGQSVRQVALTGLLKARDPESVSGWIRRYQAHGLKGLQVAAGRGRQAAFSPTHVAGSQGTGAKAGRG